MRPTRVLVIDDELQMRQALARLLRAYDVLLCDNAKVALAFLADGGMAFDVVLCDVMMAGLDGVEFFRKLALTRPDVLDRVVFMTGAVSSPRVRGLVSETCRPLLQKPFTHDELFAALGRVTDLVSTAA